MASLLILNGAIKDQFQLQVYARWNLKTKSTFLAFGFIIMFSFFEINFKIINETNLKETFSRLLASRDKSGGLKIVR